MNTTLKAVLYLIIGNGPILTQWLVLTFDTSLRGMLILLSMLGTQSAITLKAFYSNDDDEMKRLIQEATASLRPRERRAEAVNPTP